MGTITKASHERLAIECAEWRKRAVCAEQLVEAVRALLHYEITGADEDPPHLYFEEHYQAIADALSKYDRTAALAQSDGEAAK